MRSRSRHPLGGPSPRAPFPEHRRLGPVVTLRVLEPAHGSMLTLFYALQVLGDGRLRVGLDALRIPEAPSGEPRSPVEHPPGREGPTASRHGVAGHGGHTCSRIRVLGVDSQAPLQFLRRPCPGVRNPWLRSPQEHQEEAQQEDPGDPVTPSPDPEEPAGPSFLRVRPPMADGAACGTGTGQCRAGGGILGQVPKLGAG